MVECLRHMQDVVGSIPAPTTRKKGIMAGSFGEALAKGVPIVLTFSGVSRIPQVICEPGKERQALETMEKMRLIELVRPKEGLQPVGTIKVFDEKPHRSDEEVLKAAGWTIDCESPFEISCEEGGETSRANGLAARIVVDALRKDPEAYG